MLNNIIFTWDQLLSRSEICDDKFVFNPINQNILWFYISVCDGQHVQIVEPSKNLISIQFDQRRVYLLLLHNLVEIIRVVVHDYVQILRITLVSKKTVLHDEIIWVFEHCQYLMFSVLVFLILKNFLDCYSLSGLSVGPEVHNTKSSFACNSLNLVFA